MKLIIRKVFASDFGNEYHLEDEKGNILDQHVSSDDDWAKYDLLHNKPEYKDSEIEFIDGVKV